MTDIATPGDVRDYWLSTLAPKDWYVQDDAVDAAIRTQFLATWESADAGGLKSWLANADDLLAYVILCDQFPRNMFRGDPRSFATDAKALAASHIAMDRGWDLEIAEPARQFIYMTLMHAEDLAEQTLAIDMFKTRMPETGADNTDHAAAHHWVIASFGRFPYRNAALGRDTTPAEQVFLDAGAYRFALQTIRDAAAGAASDA